MNVYPDTTKWYKDDPQMYNDAMAYALIGSSLGMLMSYKLRTNRKRKEIARGPNA